jgi:hypothetical protein
LGAAPPRSTPQHRPTQARLSDAVEAWAATKDTTNIAVLEAFITRYKDTFYAELALARVEELKKQQVAIAVPPKTPPPATRCDGIEITVGRNQLRCFKPGAGKAEQFRDCPTCPEMVGALTTCHGNVWESTEDCWNESNTGNPGDGKRADHWGTAVAVSSAAVPGAKVRSSSARHSAAGTPPRTGRTIEAFG